MATVEIYNLQAQQTGTIELDDNVFSQKTNPALIYQVVRVARANQRQPLARAKMRGEVRGGGRKPWRQKGTGRARHGSIRSPIFKGGGVTFGPRPEGITRLSVPSKMRVKALGAALSDRVKNSAFIVVEGVSALDKPSTKTMDNFLKSLKIESSKVLFLSDKGMNNAVKSLNNLKNAKSIRLENINILDVLSHGYIMIPKESIDRLTRQMAK